MSKYFNVPFYLISPLFLTSVIIVRDFSQLRVGLAIYLALLLVCRKRPLPVYVSAFLLVGSIFTHISSLFFFLSYYFAKLVSSTKSKRQFLLYTILISLFFYLLINSISLFSFIDPRISLYLNWQRAGYGISRPEYLLILIYSIISLFSLPLISQTFRTPETFISSQLRLLFVLNSISCFILLASFTAPSIFVMRLYSLSATLTPLFIVFLVRYYMSSFGLVSFLFCLVSWSLCLTLWSLCFVLLLSLLLTLYTLIFFNYVIVPTLITF